MTTRTEEIRAIAHRYLAGLRNHEWDTLKSIMTDDVVWSLPGNSIIAGEAKGREAVIERIQLALGYGVKIELEHILYGLHGFSVAMHHTAQRGNLSLDLRVVNVVHLRQGKLSAIYTHFSDVEMIDAFFVSIQNSPSENITKKSK